LDGSGVYVILLHLTKLRADEVQRGHDGRFPLQMEAYDYQHESRRQDEIKLKETIWKHSPHSHLRQHRLRQIHTIQFPFDIHQSPRSWNATVPLHMGNFILVTFAAVTLITSLPRNKSKMEWYLLGGVSDVCFAQHDCRIQDEMSRLMPCRLVMN
jgi:hypothetical protein